MSSVVSSVSANDPSEFVIKEQNERLLQENANIREECARMAAVLAAAQQTIDALARLLTESQLCEFG
jgi:hypothetical protein